MDFLNNQDLNSIIFRVLILVFSVVIHEVSHGAAAYALGDSTAKDAGRLTLNPLPHIDFVGSIILPIFAGIGWAKPVPYNPYNLRNQRWGPLMIGVAGPLSNICVALFFGLLIRWHNAPVLVSLGEGFFVVLTGIVSLNLSLAFFNLIPIPPLDGSKALFAFFPNRWAAVEVFLEQYGILLILFIFFLFPSIFASLVVPAVLFVFEAITGLSFL